MSKELTTKQARFVEEYLIDLNATQAAIRAGYSAKTANTTACEYLAKPRIAAAITEAFTRRSQRTEVTQDRVVAELARVGFADIRNLFEWSEERCAFVPSSDLTDDQAAAVSAVESKTTTYTDKDGNSTDRIELKLKTYDKLGALDKLGKHLGMFVQRIEHTGAGGGPITIIEADEAKERLFDALAGIAARLMEHAQSQAIAGNGDGSAAGGGTRSLPPGANGAGAAGP